MRARTALAVVVASVLLGGCSGEPEPVETAEVPQAVETEAPAPTPSESGPSREGLVKALADKWGEMDDAERVDLCDTIEAAGKGSMWEALGSPDGISATEVDLIMADYCRDY